MLFPILALLSELLIPEAIDTSGRRASFDYDADYNNYGDHSPEECLDSYGGFRYDRDPAMDYGSYYSGTHPYHFRHRRFHGGHGNNDGHFLNKRRLNRDGSGEHGWHRHGSRYPRKWGRKPNKPNSTQAPPTQECGRNYASKIIGGEPTDARNWRWMASIMKRPNEHMCGGSLISRHYVLTAAHCIDRTNVRTIYIRLGEHDFDRTDDGNPEDYPIAKLVRHPQYDRVGYKNDVGLVKLARAATLSPSVSVVCLPKTSQEYAGKIAVTVGWGLVTYGGANSNALRKVSVLVWNNTQCSKAYSFTAPIQPYYMCAGSEDGQDSCAGDSGGPLMIQVNNRWTVIGIVSWGFRCGEPAYPGVYARVDYFLRWIKRNGLR